MTEKTVVSATGSATATRKGGPAIQEAMAQAIRDASTECEAIWARDDMSLEEKTKQIAAINDPAELRRRQLAARDQAKGKPAE